MEFSAGLLRILEVPRADVRLLALALACERQGQDLFHPPNVKGWDGGKTWLNSTTLLERGNWCNDVIWGNADFGLRPYDPMALGQALSASPRRRPRTRSLDLVLQETAARGPRGDPAAPAMTARPTGCARRCN